MPKYEYGSPWKGPTEPLDSKTEEHLQDVMADIFGDVRNEIIKSEPLQGDLDNVKKEEENYILINLNGITNRIPISILQTVGDLWYLQSTVPFEAFARSDSKWITLNRINRDTGVIDKKYYLPLSQIEPRIVIGLIEQIRTEPKIVFMATHAYAEKTRRLYEERLRTDQISYENVAPPRRPVQTWGEHIRKEAQKWRGLSPEPKLRSEDVSRVYPIRASQSDWAEQIRKEARGWTGLSPPRSEDARRGFSPIRSPSQPQRLTSEDAMRGFSPIRSPSQPQRLTPDGGKKTRSKRRIVRSRKGKTRRFL
jgi:hypothetical protein